MSTDAAKGKTALDNSDYATAITHLTAALKTSQSPTWLFQRSIAYHRTRQYELALADADNAVLAAIARGKRELIATAHFRRAIALHGLKRFGDARLCLHWCHEFNEKEKGLTIWVAKVKKDYDDAGGDEAECNHTSVKKIPDKVEEVSSNTKATDPKENKLPVEKSKGKATETAGGTSVTTTSQTPKDRIRHEWYQSPNNITIEVLAKGVPKASTVVDIRQGSLEVSFPLENTHSSYDLTFSPLFAKIDKEKSSFRITPHKIEIILQKAMPGIKWASLEGTDPIAEDVTSETVPKIPDAALSAKPQEQVKAPAYPTSSRSGPKNWDTVAADEKDEEGDGPDAFFKVLYKNADPDTKRAMMKSYMESNGTALSTSWSDVGSRTVETVPPEGVEAKKWDA